MYDRELFTKWSFRDISIPPRKSFRVFFLTGYLPKKIIMYPLTLDHIFLPYKLTDSLHLSLLSSFSIVFSFPPILFFHFYTFSPVFSIHDATHQGLLMIFSSTYCTYSVDISVRYCRWLSVVFTMLDLLHRYHRNF
jgi:hypothetical protein